MESSAKCHIEPAGLNQPLPEKSCSYLLAKPKFKWGIAAKSRNWTSVDTQRWGQTWRREVERETKKLGKSWRELKLLAINRKRWRAGIVESRKLAIISGFFGRFNEFYVTYKHLTISFHSLTVLSHYSYFHRGIVRIHTSVSWFHFMTSFAFLDDFRIRFSVCLDSNPAAEHYLAQCADNN